MRLVGRSQAGTPLSRLTREYKPARGLTGARATLRCESSFGGHEQESGQVTTGKQLLSGCWRPLVQLWGCSCPFRCLAGWFLGRVGSPEMAITDRAFPKLLGCPWGLRARVLKVHLGPTPLTTNGHIRGSHGEILVLRPFFPQHASKLCLLARSLWKYFARRCKPIIGIAE